MKKAILFFLATGFTMLAHAQLQLIDPVDVVIGSVSVPEDYEMTAKWDVVNMGMETLNVRAKRIQMDIVPGSQNRFCWGPLCYDYPTNESSTNVNLIIAIDPAATDTSFRGYYEHQGNAGHSVIKYCFFDHYNPEIEACHIVHFCVDNECVIGIEDHQAEGIISEIGPNPLSGMGSFTYSFNFQPENARIVMYNLVGERVQEVPLENRNGFVFINGQDFETGVYFYALEADGKVFSTKKLVVTR